MVNTKFFRRPCFSFKVYEYLTGLASCFVFIFYVDNLACASDMSVKLCKATESVLITAVVTYPLIIQPSLLIALVFHENFHRSILQPLLMFGGFICTLVAGALTLQYDLHDKGLKGMGAFLILSAALYISDFVVHFVMRNRD